MKMFESIEAFDDIEGERFYTRCDVDLRMQMHRVVTQGERTDHVWYGWLPMNPEPTEADVVTMNRSGAASIIVARARDKAGQAA